MALSRSLQNVRDTAAPQLAVFRFFLVALPKPPNQMKHAITTLLSVFTILIYASSQAQEPTRTVPDPAELSARRAEFLREMQRVSAPVLTNYLRVIESLKEQSARRGDLQPAQAYDTEAKKIRTQLGDASATASGARSSVSLPVEITSALWQSVSPKLSADVTAHLKKVMESGAVSVTVNTAEAAGGADLARGKSKVLVLEYTVNGKVKKKTYPEGEKLNFADLK
jgi:hypothetical protein